MSVHTPVTPERSCVKTDNDPAKKQRASPVYELVSSGIPSCVHAVTGIKSLPAKKQSEAKKVLQRLVEKRFPGQSPKVFSLDSPQDSLLLLRQANEQKRKIPSLRKHRSYLLAENVAFQDAENGELLFWSTLSKWYSNCKFVFCRRCI